MIFNFGNIRGISSFPLGLWKKKRIFCFLAFKESLFELKHWLILASLAFTVENNFSMFEWSKKRLVSSADILGSSTEDALT